MRYNSVTNLNGDLTLDAFVEVYDMPPPPPPDATLPCAALPRKSRRMGVPSNPIFSRRFLSRYFLYDSSKSLGLFTKNTKVGGLVAACVQ